MIFRDRSKWKAEQQQTIKSLSSPATELTKHLTHNMKLSKQKVNGMVECEFSVQLRSICIYIYIYEQAYHTKHANQRDCVWTNKFLPHYCFTMWHQLYYARKVTRNINKMLHELPRNNRVFMSLRDVQILMLIARTQFDSYIYIYWSWCLTLHQNERKLNDNTQQIKKTEPRRLCTGVLATTATTAATSQYNLCINAYNPRNNCMQENISTFLCSVSVYLYIHLSTNDWAG